MERLGLGYEDLRATTRSSIYCSISAFGQNGPRAEEGGFDLTMQAMSGVMSVTGEPGGAPVKCGVPLSDFCAGLYAAFAIVAVLRACEQGGDGAHIDVSMLGASARHRGAADQRMLRQRHGSEQARLAHRATRPIRRSGHRTPIS